MIQQELFCRRCGSEATTEDNYCRQCGATLRAARLPVIGNWRPELKPWLVNEPVVRGVAALAVGAAFELLRRELNRRLNAPAGSPSTVGWTATPQPPTDGSYQISETSITITRRFFTPKS